jgi:hypothetical protein
MNPDAESPLIPENKPNVSALCLISLLKARVFVQDSTSPPKMLPFVVLLVIFTVGAGILIALSFFVGGCQSDPLQCFEGVLNLPASFPVTPWIRGVPAARCSNTNRCC